MKARIPLVGLAACLLLLGAAADRPRAGAVDDARMLRAASDPTNWVVNGGDLEGRHYSSLDQINETNVSRLGPAWTFDFDTWRTQESEPLVVDGVMYVTTAWSKVYALDAATGKQLWAFDPAIPKERGVNACCDVVNRGAAVYKGRVYFGTIDGRLIALDARTGKQAWSVQTTPPDRAYSITGAPRVIKDKVIIGNGGGEFDARGFVTAYDTATGKKVWRFYLVPGDPAKRDHEVSDEPLERLARPTWFGDTYYKAGGGGTAWNAIHYDPELDQILIGTGNGTPWNQFYRSQGKGDNLFLCSILALDANTGKYRWHYQENPGETWDYNATQPMITATLTIDGKPRKVVMHAPKNGFFYVVDRTNGKLISATKIVEAMTWASGVDLATGRPIEKPGARYEKTSFALYPGPAGAHNWHAMSYNPATGLVYLPVGESSYMFQNASTPFVSRKGGVINDGLEHKKPMDPAAPTQISVPDKLIAIDPVAGRIVWSVPSQGGGTLATAGNLIIQGRGVALGDLAAFRATDGKLLWSRHVPNGVVANPITYMVGGTQYIAVAAGRGGSSTQFAGANGIGAPSFGRMVVFRLDGKAVLPPDPQPLPPVQRDNRVLARASVIKGQLAYVEYCIRCHGAPPVRPSPIGPDIRRSQFLLDPDAWKAVVMEGALSHQGMVGWKSLATPEEAEAIRDYVQDAARDTRQATVSGGPH